MKSILYMLSLLLGTCSGILAATVTVTNPTDMYRHNETVELSWNEVKAKVAGATATTVIVLDEQGKQVPSQVLFKGERAPQSLIFQVTLGPKSSAHFTVKTGRRDNYPVQAYGRYVPERLDDYAWENNLVAFRAYGPALEKETITQGMDVWMKRTPEMIINKWYRQDLEKVSSYHNDTGEGCDCYKVGVTLGCGASAPYVDGKVVISDRNYTSQRNLDNGPIRTTVLLTYGPQKIGDMEVSLEKEISLDANSHFNRITDIYTGSFKTLPIAAGDVIHDGARTHMGKDFVAMMEAASDSRTGNDGDIACAVVMPGMEKSVNGPEHVLAIRTVRSGEPLVYYSGAGWSKNGVPDMDTWVRMTTDKAMNIQHPLQVTFK